MKSTYLLPNRINRLAFWLGSFAVSAIGSLVQVVRDTTDNPVLSVATMAINIGLLVVLAWIWIGRLHDLHRLGWWLLILGFPFASFWLLAIPFGLMIWSFTFVAGLAGLIMLAVLPGTNGPNRYGPNSSRRISFRGNNWPEPVATDPRHVRGE